MTDAVLIKNDRQEALSRAYAQAVAAAAGYSTSQPDFDRDSIDLTISAGGDMRPKLDIQLKATINLDLKDEIFSFPLPVKNYNDLRAESQTPRVLLVLDMPRDEKDWFELTAEQLVLRRAAYWASLRNRPESDNTTSVTVSIPASNLFDVNGLKALMAMSRTGVIE